MKITDILDPIDCDIGVDAAGRVYKYLFGKWVAQGRSSEPVYPVLIIARWVDGDYTPWDVESKTKLRSIVDMLPEIKQLLIWCAGTVAETDMHKIQAKIEKWEMNNDTRRITTEGLAERH